MMSNPFLQQMLLDQMLEIPSPPADGFGYAGSSDPYTAFDPLMSSVLPYNYVGDIKDPYYLSINNQVSSLAQATQEVLGAPDRQNGAHLVAYLGKGNQSYARDVQSKLDDVLSVKDKGAIGDGVTDDSNAFISALSDLSSAGGGTLHIPAGTYVLNQTLVLPNNVSIVGEGQNNTLLVMKTANLTVFSYTNPFANPSSYWPLTPYVSNLEIRDLSIAASAMGVVGLYFNQAYCTFVFRVAFLGLARNVEIDRGSDHTLRDCYCAGYGTSPMGAFRIWSSNDIDHVFNVTMDNVLCAPNAAGTLTSMDPAQFYLRRVVNSYFLHLNTTTLVDTTGVAYQNGIILENDCQGVMIGDSIFVHVRLGVVIRRGSGAAIDPGVITLKSVSVDQASQNGYVFINGHDIAVFGGGLTPNAPGISINPIVVYSGCYYVTFDSVIVDGFSGSGGSGFFLAGCSYVNITNCQILNCYNAFVMSANPTHIRAFSNLLANCSAPYIGSLIGAGNYFAQNDGFNPMSVSAPTVPASGSALTNTIGVRCTVYVTGGTVTGYAINGQNLPGLSGTQKFELEPGESIMLTYSAIPSWTWIGH